MKIREYLPGDFLDIVDLWTQCDLIRPWNDPEQDIARAMSSPCATILIGFLGEELVASCMVGHDGHRGWLYYVGVSPSHRKQGLGRAITSAAEEWLKNQGAIKAMLMVRTTNQAVLDFYHSVGYTDSASVPVEKWLTPDGQRPNVASE